MLWIPDGYRALQVWPLVCAHVEEAGHQGVDATLHRLREHCNWRTIKADIRECLRQCPYCADYIDRRHGASR